jgi:hypothetical protein
MRFISFGLIDEYQIFSKVTVYARQVRRSSDACMKIPEDEELQACESVGNQ